MIVRFRFPTLIGGLIFISPARGVSIEVETIPAATAKAPVEYRPIAPKAALLDFFCGDWRGVFFSRF
jgi:hypothetical protein